MERLIGIINARTSLLNISSVGGNFPREFSSILSSLRVCWILDGNFPTFYQYGKFTVDRGYAKIKFSVRIFFPGIRFKFATLNPSARLRMYEKYYLRFFEFTFLEFLSTVIFLLLSFFFLIWYWKNDRFIIWIPYIALFERSFEAREAIENC